MDTKNLFSSRIRKKKKKQRLIQSYGYNKCSTISEGKNVSSDMAVGILLDSSEILLMQMSATYDPLHSVIDVSNQRSAFITRFGPTIRYLCLLLCLW